LNLDDPDGEIDYQIFPSSPGEQTYETLWDYFKRTVRRMPNNKFLGYRENDSDSS